LIALIINIHTLGRMYAAHLLRDRNPERAPSMNAQLRPDID